MNILFDTLPTTIKIDGNDVPIKTDFRCWIRFENVIQEYNLEAITIDEFVEMMNRIISILFLESQYIEPTYSLFIELINFFVGFDQGKKSKDSTQKVFDFQVDSNAIYASFLKEYGIRLTNEEMHWYEFRTLFSNLSSDTPIGKLIQIRTTDEKDISQEKRAEFRKLKEEVALPVFGSYKQDANVLKKLRDKLR